MFMMAFRIAWNRKRRQQQRHTKLVKDRHWQKWEKTSRQRRRKTKKQRKKIQREGQSKRRGSRLRAMAAMTPQIRRIRAQGTRRGTLARGQRSRYWIWKQVMKLLWQLKEKRQLPLPMQKILPATKARNQLMEREEP